MQSNNSKKNDNVYIDVEPENNLIDYTQNHFLNQMNIDMGKIRDNTHSYNDNMNMNFSNSIYIRDSHSPITVSNNNSDNDEMNDNEMNDDEMDYENINNIRTELHSDNELKNMDQYQSNYIATTIIKTTKFRKLSYKDIEKSLNQSYTENSKYSNELEILITYLKCQTNLYIQSKNVTNFKLNMLMVPTILISSFITLLAPFITDYYWGGSFISGLNAMITLLISLVNYYKFETTNQIFSNLAKQYDKLQSKLEIANSKLLFIDNEVEQTKLIMDKIHEFEDNMSEIKENSSVFIPEELKPLFPLICHINIFSLIKKIETYKKTLIVKYKDVKNEMRYIFYKHNNINNNNIDHVSHPSLSHPSLSHPSLSHLSPLYNSRSKNRLLLLVDIKTKLKEEIINYKNAYYYIDQAFTQEIVDAEKKKNIWIWIFFFGNNYKVKNNELIKKYIE